MNATGIQPVTTPTTLGLPAGQRGLFVLPASGRKVFWTGRVAIGLRHALGDAPSNDPNQADDVLAAEFDDLGNPVRPAYREARPMEHRPVG